MNLTKGSKIVIVLSVLSVIQFLFMLYFRAAIYADMYIAPDEPYGISDIIELLLGCIFILLSVVSGIVAIVLLIRGAKQSRVFAGFLIVLHVILYVIFGPLHILAANYGIA